MPWNLARAAMSSNWIAQLLTMDTKGHVIMGTDLEHFNKSCSHKRQTNRERLGV